MLDHVYIVASDMVAAERFYDAVMGALGVVKVGSRADWIGYGERADAGHPDRIYIAIRQGTVPQAPYPLHWCFKARSRAQVDAFWDAGRAAGGSDAGPVDDGGRGAADFGNRGAAGDIEQGAIDGEAGTPADRGHPVHAAEVDRHRLVDGRKQDRGTEAARRGASGPVQPAADRVGF